MEKLEAKVDENAAPEAVDCLRLGFINRQDHWVADKDRKVCSACETKFSLRIRKHHCRICGEVYCSYCTQQKVTWNGNQVSPCCDG